MTRNYAETSSSAEEATIVTEFSDQTAATPVKKRPGRKVSPLTLLIRNWEQAQVKADKARAAYDKVSTIAVRLEEAEAAEVEAYNALQQGLKEAGAAQ